MPPKKRRVKRKKYHIVLILLLIIVGVFFFIEESGKENIPQRIFNLFKPEKTGPETLADKKPELPPPRPLPKVSIIIDDLGPNKKMALEVLTIDAPLTLSILPLEVYSTWIAEEGHKIGRDIIVHVPMEATRPLRLGNGGLFTWMTEKEIRTTLKKGIESVPHVIGASSHMGSAFTADERVMTTVLSELKKQDLFFLDSLTTPKTIGYKLARAQGVVALKRDVFLDDSSNISDIEIQWNRMVALAQRKGYAIALAHARRNTIDFLLEQLRDNTDIEVVPVSALIN